MSNEWIYWATALKGEFIEDMIQRGQPQSGFYRDRSKRAVAIWRDDTGIRCQVTSGYEPRQADEIDELFGFICRTPISRDLYMEIKNGGKWPEDIDVPDRGIGDNYKNLDPHEAIKAEINDLVDAARKWLASIDNKISNQEQADKVANYADAFGELEKRAESARKAEKEPHDKAAKAVQAKWLPVVELADEKKRWLKKTFEAYALAEKRRREEEARKAAELARIEAEKASIAGDPLPPDPEPEPVKNVSAGTRGRVSLKTRTDWVVSDLPAFAAYLAAMETPAPEFVEVCRKLANKIGAVGGAAPGIEKKITEYAA